MDSIPKNNQKLNAGSLTSDISKDSESTGQVVSYSKNTLVKTSSFGLTLKLLLTTIIFTVACEITVLIPSISNFHATWIHDKFTEADAGVRVFNESQENLEYFPEFLLDSTGAEVIAEEKGQTRVLHAMRKAPARIDREINLNSSSVFDDVTRSINTLFFGGNRVVRIASSSQYSKSSQVEIIFMESKIRASLIQFAIQVIGISLPIIVLVSALLFFSLYFMIVRPVQRLSKFTDQVAENPEGLERIKVLSNRTDEIGKTQKNLVNMEERLQSTIREHRHLANLGLAVSKINHDLRNILASAQLLLERLEDLPDPTVRRLAPKIISTLDRAVSYTRTVLDYGKTQEAPPKRKMIHLSPLVSEIGEVLSLDTNKKIDWSNNVDDGIEVDADPEHLFRILMNLCQNSLQALESKKTPVIIKQIAVSAERQGSVVQIEVSDTGPGVPYLERTKIFHAFQSSLKTGGFGLGLSIAAELVEAHGGKISLKESDTGAIFEISIPDSPIEFSTKRKDSQKHSFNEQLEQTN